MNFNESQLQAVSHFQGPMLVLAGPGSGKTTVIIHRISNLISCYGIHPQNILSVTFSRAAAAEMAGRFSSVFSFSDPCPVFATFHSIFLTILKSESSGSFNIISERQKSVFIRSEAEKYNISNDNPAQTVKDILTYVSRSKCHGPQDAASAMENNPVYKKIASAYQSYMNREGLMDFDDIIIRCSALLAESPEVLEKWQHRFPYILVDEFQDISPMQYNVVKLLAGSSANIMAVGDDDQSIYGFRGASPASLMQFLEDYPGAPKVLLNVNYRCRPAIVRASLEVINANKDRFEKELIPFTDISEPDTLTFDSFAGRIEEYRHIIDRIRAYHESNITDIAVLFRNNADYMLLSRMLADGGIAFESAEIPDNFLNSFIVKDLWAYMNIARLASSCSFVPCRDSFLRIINKPARYISRDCLSSCAQFGALHCMSTMKNYYRTNLKIISALRLLEQDLAYISALAPFAQIKYIRSVMGYDGWLKGFADEKGTDIDELINIADMFEEYASEFSTFTGLEKAMEESRHAGNDSAPEGSDTAQKESRTAPVRIMTMHASKGMEFDVVFIPDTNEGVVPNKRNLAEGGECEERRLFYVSMTRAKKHLHISYVRMLHNKSAHPSRFLSSFSLHA